MKYVNLYNVMDFISFYIQLIYHTDKQQKISFNITLIRCIKSIFNEMFRFIYYVTKKSLIF